jgi:cold shock protein
MPTDAVKRFNATKGYGFIQPQGGGTSRRWSALGPKSLNEWQSVEFEIVSNRGKTPTENLRVR